MTRVPFGKKFLKHSLPLLPLTLRIYTWVIRSWKILFMKYFSAVFNMQILRSEEAIIIMINEIFIKKKIK